MGLETIAEQWKNEMSVIGVDIESDHLDCIKEIKEDDRDPISIVKEIRNEMFISVKSEEVTKFFYDLFEKEELAYHFAFNYGLYVDITEDGEVVIRDNVEPDELPKSLVETAINELVGSEKSNSIIMIDVFDKDKIKNTLDIEIENKMKEYFKPLAKQVDSKLYELEEKLLNEII